MNTKRLVLAGGTGFVGSALAAEGRKRHLEVVILTRRPRSRADGVREVEWDGEHLGEWIKFVEGADAVVNLAGENVNRPHTPENVRAITSSRVNPTTAIGAAIYHVARPPKVWVQASAIGYYGDAGDRLCDENTPPGNDTLAGICKQWEAAFASAKTGKTRRVLFRIGLVLGREGGALPVLERLTKWFLGGRAGSGKQFISWIHLTDLVRMTFEAIDREDVEGTFNAVGPQPVTNKDFMRELREALHRPWSPPAPAWAIRLGATLMGGEPTLVLTSCRATPKRWAEAGFSFTAADLARAFKSLYP